jgi:hypothetical protein
MGLCFGLGNKSAKRKQLGLLAGCEIDPDWFPDPNPDRCQVTQSSCYRYLPTPNGSQWAKIQEADYANTLPECGEENTNDELPPDI